MEAAVGIMEQFEPISLEEMDGVKLMNRMDSKYVFTRDQFERIMEEVRKYYRILEIEGKRASRYKTLYYDTPTLDLYYNHHRGKLNRYKIRHRTYVESNTGFLEVKFKSNKGRTIKNRIKKYDVPFSWEDESEQFLNGILPFQPKMLVPVLWINYNRHTLVSKSGKERVTIDLDLEFVRDDHTHKLNNVVIAEVKQDKRESSVFAKVMKKYHIREGAISKYCLGMAMVYNDIKKNNFKRKLLSIKHIEYGNVITNSR